MPAIEITFGQTNSPLVADAVSLARKLPSFRQQLEGKRTVYSVVVPLADAIASETICKGLLSLVGVSSRWQTTRLTLDGEQIGRRELDTQLRGICECFQSRSESQMGDEYCSGKQHPAARLPALDAEDSAECRDHRAPTATPLDGSTTERFRRTPRVSMSPSP